MATRAVIRMQQLLYREAVWLFWYNAAILSHSNGRGHGDAMRQAVFKATKPEATQSQVCI